MTPDRIAAIRAQNDIDHADAVEAAQGLSSQAARMVEVITELLAEIERKDRG